MMIINWLEMCTIFTKSATGVHYFNPKQNQLTCCQEQFTFATRKFLPIINKHKDAMHTQITYFALYKLKHNLPPPL